jgi:predicted transcriptional regulator
MSAKESVPELSPAEWQMMKVFWEGGALAARDAYAALPEGHGWAYNTAKTLLARLVAKGALDYTQVGNSYLYEAACRREDVVLREMEEFVERVLDGEPAPVAVHLVRRAKLSREDVAELRLLLDQKERESKGRGDHG